jgi:predicted Zn-dependent protease with MMP-like domain
MPRKFDTPPDLADLDLLAREAFASLPEHLRRHATDVPIRIEDFPDAETGKDMGLESPFDLLGLYRGVSLDHKSVGDAPHDIDIIFLYRRPILDYWSETGEDLYHIVRHVLIHEIGHHFGLSDEEMERIEEDA